MTTVVFEAATIIDTLTRAEKAAPKVTAHSDNRFAGIIIEGEGEFVTVRTTNEKVYYHEIVDTLAPVAERVAWRLPSAYLASVIGTFTSRSGDTITFDSDAGVVEITQARKKARLPLISMKDFPQWYESDTANASVVADLGYAIKLVEWAGDPSSQNLNVIRITPDALYTTNLYIMARSPIKIDGLTEPFMIEIGEFSGLIPQRGELKLMRVGGQVLLQVNDRIQVRGITVDTKFPNVEGAAKVEYEHTLITTKDEFLKLIKTGQSLQSRDKTSIMRFFIGNGVVAGFMEHEGEVTAVRDIIDVTGAEHDVFELEFNPVFISNAISNAPDEFIKIHYNTSRVMQVKVECQQYECWVTPIKRKK